MTPEPEPNTGETDSAAGEVGSTTGETDQDSRDQESAQEATKRRFREALEAKQGRRGQDHIDTDPHPSDQTHGPAGGKRVFRRKTG